MAILNDVPGIQVTVQVAGIDLVEYDAGEEERKSRVGSTTCPAAVNFIECIDEAEFAIKIAAGREYAWSYKKHSLRFVVYIDGNRITSRIVSRTGDPETINQKVAFCSQSRRWKTYSLKFSAISTIDDSQKERVARDREIAKRLGHIRVVVERCVKGRQGSKAVDRSANPIQKFELARKSLKGKAISHGTSFSPRGNIHRPKCRFTKDLPGEKGPLAVFHFIYQSKDALQQNLVIPRDVPPSPSRSFDELSSAEKELLAKQRFEQMQGNQEPKDEARRIIKRKAVKMEDLTEEDENPSPAKRLAHFIDLTID
ncbi:hypothetical protein F4803DRAFT_549752 [Xylaria telfairii]|nr:hypothetical protein F4803DRAFT_549752 [Xylaria telfairii]